MNPCLKTGITFLDDDTKTVRTGDLKYLDDALTITGVNPATLDQSTRCDIRVTGGIYVPKDSKSNWLEHRGFTITAITREFLAFMAQYNADFYNDSFVYDHIAAECKIVDVILMDR